MDIDSLIESLPDRLSLLKNEVTGQGMSSQQVADLAITLGVRFPKSYVAFLRKYGWADLEYLQLYGHGDDVPKQLNLVDNTTNRRQQAASPLPPHLIPVITDAAGNAYCLDCQTLDRNEECPVVFWEHDLGADQTPEIDGEDYLTWLQRELDEILADD
jgi:hypothetical protein